MSKKVYPLTSLIIFLLIFSFSSCSEIKKAWEEASSESSSSKISVITGVWQKYKGTNTNFQYMIISNGIKTPFILSGGDKYLNSRVSVTVKYINSSSNFTIQNVKVIAWAKKTETSTVSTESNTQNTTNQEEDSMEVVNLSLSITSEIDIKKQEMSSFYKEVEKQIDSIKNKLDDFASLRGSSFEEEVKRIKILQKAAIDEINQLVNWIDEIELVWISEINSVSWANNSENRKVLMDKINRVITNLHNEYDQKLNSLRYYIQNIDLPK